MSSGRSSILVLTYEYSPPERQAHLDVALVNGLGFNRLAGTTELIPA